MNKILFKITFLLLACLCAEPFKACSDKTQDNESTFELKNATTVNPEVYDNAFVNPLKGFTTTNGDKHLYASLTHTYIPWNAIEQTKEDGVEKIKAYCNTRWKDLEKYNMKVIPRVYLHYDGDKKYWPSDMASDDYSSAVFKERVVALIQKLGLCWDNDPRVAFIEMGIFGKWGEHHSPTPTKDLQEIVGAAFAKNFKNKKVSVRKNWCDFTGYGFGEYWDSWAHYDQMWSDGNSILKNNNTGLFKTNYIGGEVAYNWGNVAIQPGSTPTESVAETEHLSYVLNTIKWLHCTQFRWITGYDKNNDEANKGANEIQKALGYRFVIKEVDFSMTEKLNIMFTVCNVGSAPFYYNWPVEISLLDINTLRPVWRTKMVNTDIREWLPGDNWTSPDWIPTSSYQLFLTDKINWSSTQIGWAESPKDYKEHGSFQLDVHSGKYLLAIAILDPSGNNPSVRFAIKNYIKGGRHPLGVVDLDTKTCSPLPDNFSFDDIIKDTTLSYSL